MNLFKPVILYLFFSCVYFTVSAQLSESYFNDTELKDMSSVFCYLKNDPFIIIGGISFENQINQPVIMKIDTLSNIIWSTSDVDSSMYPSFHNSEMKMIYSNGYIYAIIFSSYVNNAELWKVDEQSGRIIWKSKINDPQHSYSTYLLDYDETHILLKLNKGTNSNILNLYSKLDGNLVSSQPFLYPNSINIDNDKNIYFESKDTFYKSNALEPLNPIWKMKYFPEMQVDRIYVDEGENVYLFTRGASLLNGKVIAVNKLTGELQWQIIVPSTANYQVEEMRKMDNSLVISWRSTTCCHNNYCKISKINIQDGVLIWNKTYSFVGEGNPGVEPTRYQSLTSMDFDDKGDIYFTGYYGSDIGSGCWGILKVNGENGEKIYETSVTSNPDKRDGSSIGLASIVINNQAYYVGDIQTTYNISKRTKITLVNLNSESGELKFSKGIGGSHQFPSYTIDIKKFKDKTLVLKQIGRFMHIELYDKDKILLWNKILEREYVLIGDKIAISDDKIILTGFTPNISYSPPFYNHWFTNNLYIFVFDSLGNLENEHVISNESAQTVGHFIIGEDLFVFYNTKECSLSSGCLVVNKYSNGILVGMKQICNLENKFQKNVVDLTPASFLIFGKKPNNNTMYVFELNKSTLSNKEYHYILSMNHVNFVLKKDNETCYILGKNTNGFDILLEYNYKNKKEVWRNNYNSDLKMTKVVMDSLKSSIYVLCNKNSQACILKLDANTGTEISQNIHSTNSSISSEYKDICFFENQNQIIAVGAQKEFTPEGIVNNVLIKKIHTSMQEINTITKTGNDASENAGTVAAQIGDGSIWVGGNMNLTNFPKAGFIFEVSSSSLEDFLNISGNVFLDENQNGQKEIGEVNLNVSKTTLYPYGIGYNIRENGKYSFFVEPGTYTVNYEELSDWKLTTDSSSYTVKLDSINVENLDFGIYPLNKVNKITPLIASGINRCNRMVNYSYCYANNGTTLIDSLIIASWSPFIDSVEFINVPDTIFSNNSVGWKTNKLKPGESQCKKINLLIPGIGGSVFPGQKITSELNIFSNIENGIDTFSYIYSTEILCAYDPNDKLVQPNLDGDKNFTLFGEDLTYTIRFQNTGNDTAFNVLVIDTLDENLDFSTFRVIGSSHSESMVINTFNEGQIIHFKFSDILLPDSLVDFDGSQGFVAYTIKAKELLPENTTIENKASIYFDYNPPIITNTTINIMVSKIPDTSNIDGSNYESTRNIIKIFPNPADEYLFVHIDNPSFSDGVLRISNIFGTYIYGDNFSAINDTLIKTDTFISGIYFINIVDSNGNIIGSKKFIIK